MATQGMEFIDRNVQLTNNWLRMLARSMDVEDEQTAYHALRGVLFPLRDRLTVEETHDLAAQLPTMLRGLYFEGYRPSGKPDSYRDLDTFLDRVRGELEQTGGDIDAEEAARAVFGLLSDNLPGVSDHTREMLPAEIQELWPEGVTA